MSEKKSGFSAEERAAMKERAAELKAEERRSKAADKAAAAEQDALDKIAEMPAPDQAIATKFHECVKANAPELSAKTWYGMPAYARDGKIVCFFQGAAKFEARYATIGFNDSANLDDGDLWPTAFAVLEWTPAVEKQVVALVTKAVRTT